VKKLLHWMVAGAVAAPPAAAGAGKTTPSPIDVYIQQAASNAAKTGPSPGSLFAAGGRLAELGRDLRAAQVDDIVTIVVADKASAIARGTTNTARKSSASAGIPSLFGPRKMPLLSDLAKFGGEQELQGQGTTTRETVLTTTISARVTHVLPNGYLVVEGAKDISVNSERQQVSVRGVARWNDLGPGNLIRSDRLAHLEVRVNGKGVVGDAIRRPNILFRILTGLLPF
jgi:flagellar L-ring protein precursor FlgH